MIAGDLIRVSSPQSTGFTIGDIGLIVKVEQISKDIMIYWVCLGNYNGYAPFWEGEIELLETENETG